VSTPDSSDTAGANGMSEASLFEAIAHEARIKTLFLLQNEPLGFSELKKKLGLTSSGNLQHHINKLGVLIEQDADGQYTLTDNGKEAIMAIRAIRSMQDRLKINMRGMIFFGTLVFYVIELTVPFLTGTVGPWTPVNVLITSVAFGTIFYVIWSAVFKVIMNKKAESSIWIKREE
jgi:DNA-binding HxlR family transcriptional regulator